MGSSCNKYGRKMHTAFWWGTPILKCTFKKSEEKWMLPKTAVAQHRHRWLARVKVVTNLRVPYNGGNFLSSWISITFSFRTLLRVVSSYRHFWSIPKHPHYLARSLFETNLKFIHHTSDFILQLHVPSHTIPAIPEWQIDLRYLTCQLEHRFIYDYSFAITIQT